MSYLKTLLIICPIFFISGIIDSIGGGGGLIALPTYLMIGLPVRSAYGCNKLQAGLGNLVSAIKYFKNNMVDLRIALVSAITAMTGAWIGTKIIFLLPEESIQKAITVALPVIALIMVLRKTDARNVIMRSEISKKTVVQALIVGVIMGFYNSLFGPGIGTVAIIAFTMIMHYDVRRHIVVGANRTVFSPDSPTRSCRAGTYRTFLPARRHVVIALFERQHCCF